MRLIDADRLKEDIIKCLKPSEPEKEMIDVDVALVSTLVEIDEQPTAFDVDKIIDGLKRLPKCSFWNHNSDNIDRMKAIEIVEGGVA